MKQFSCKYCGSTDLFTEKRGSQTALCCGDCGKFNKWLPKDEINTFKYFKQNQEKTTSGRWKSVKRDPPPKQTSALFFSKGWESVAIADLISENELEIQDGDVYEPISLSEGSFYWCPLPEIPTEEEMKQLDEE